MKELRFLDSAVAGLVVVMMGRGIITPPPPPPAPLPAPTTAATLGGVGRQRGSTSILSSRLLKKGDGRPT
jgi:hypothetical protein